MDPSRRRLILVPQLRVKMRYQDWWCDHFVQELGKWFDIRLLGGVDGSVEVPPDRHSLVEQAIKQEVQQIDEYLSLDLRPTDILLHMDLSFPGLFHSVLYHKRPHKAIVFCHGTSRNRYDVFQKIRGSKWVSEVASSRLYDRVIVASQYHKEKLGWLNVVNLGALPPPPVSILPPSIRNVGKRSQYPFGSVSRLGRQKVNQALEKELERVSGSLCARFLHRTWTGYFQFLDRIDFLLITSREETYGYQVVDAVLRGAFPIAPKAYSYPELLGEEFLYDPDLPLSERVRCIADIMLGTDVIHRKAVVKNELEQLTFFERLKNVLLEG